VFPITLRRRERSALFSLGSSAAAKCRPITAGASALLGAPQSHCVSARHCSSRHGAGEGKPGRMGCLAVMVQS